MVVRILNGGCDVDAADDIGWTPLMHAAANGKTEVVQLLIKGGSNVNKKTKNAVTALMIAAGLGHESVVRLLVEHGAVVDLKDNLGTTALSRAEDKGYTNIVSLLQGVKVHHGYSDPDADAPKKGYPVSFTASVSHGKFDSGYENPILFEFDMDVKTGSKVSLSKNKTCLKLKDGRLIRSFAFVFSTVNLAAELGPDSQLEGDAYHLDGSVIKTGHLQDGIITLTVKDDKPSRFSVLFLHSDLSNVKSVYIDEFGELTIDNAKSVHGNH